jgi:hypothetical protein
METIHSQSVISRCFRSHTLLGTREMGTLLQRTQIMSRSSDQSETSHRERCERSQGMPVPAQLTAAVSAAGKARNNAAYFSPRLSAVYFEQRGSLSDAFAIGLWCKSGLHMRRV